MTSKKGLSQRVLIGISLILIVVAFVAGMYVDRLFFSTSTAPLRVLVVGMSEDLSMAFTPLWIQGGVGLVTNSIFEGLVEYKPSTTLPLEIGPVLATEWNVSGNGLEWTFKLRQGVKFHDGTPFNATAVKTHFDKSMVLKKGISYIFSEGLLNRTDIMDTYVVKFVLNYPTTVWLDILQHAACMIESPTSIALYGDEGINEHPIGTGPFKFVSTIVGSEAIIEANQEWWRIQQGLEQPIQIDRIIFRTFADSATMKLALERGDIHVSHGAMAQNEYPTLLNRSDIVGWERPITAHLRWIQFQHNGTRYPYFAHKEVRQAFAYAINYAEITEVIFDDGKYAKRATSFLPEEYIEHTDAFAKYIYNATKSLELIREAGFVPPITVTLTIVPNHYTPYEEDIAALIKSRAEPAGFIVNIETMDYNAMKAKFKAAQTEMSVWGWRAIVFDTDYWSTFIHSSKYSGQPSEFKAGDMAPLFPYIDDLLAQAASATNQTEKTQIWGELQDLYAEWVPGVPLFRPVAYDFTRANVHGVLLTPIGPDIRFFRTSISD